MRFASYLSDEWGTWAQYDRAQAGFYRNAKRADRRSREIAAHNAGVQQLPRRLNHTAETLQAAAT